MRSGAGEGEDKSKEMMNMNKYNVTYSYGCVHEIKEENGLHEPTGNNKDCEIHKEKIDEHA